MSNSSILRKASKDRYSTIDLQAMDEDSRLSFKEAGILYYLLTRPDGWEFNRQDVINRKSDGRTAISNGLSNLKEYGYLEIEERQDNEGKFNGYVWHITPDPEELPLSESTSSESQETRCSDNPTHNNRTLETSNTSNNKDSNESLPDGFKEQQGWIVKRLSPHVADEGKLWGLSGKWINDYGFHEVASVVRSLDNKGKLDNENIVGYIVAILESDQKESESTSKEWEAHIEDLDLD